MGRRGWLAGIGGVLLSAVLATACSGAATAAPGASTPGESASAPALSGTSVGPSTASSAAAPSAPGGSVAFGATTSPGTAATGTAVPLGSLPRLVVSVAGSFDKTGNGVYAGATDDYKFSASGLVIQPGAGGSASIRGRLTLTETEKTGGAYPCHGTFKATYAITGTASIGGDPSAPVYVVDLALAHPPVDRMTLHCTLGMSVSTNPHGATIGQWSSLLVPVDIPYTGGTVKRTATSAIPYFDLQASGTFVARPG